MKKKIYKILESQATNWPFLSPDHLLQSLLRSTKKSLGKVWKLKGGRVFTVARMIINPVLRFGDKLSKNKKAGKPANKTDQISPEC